MTGPSEDIRAGIRLGLAMLVLAYCLGLFVYGMTVFGDFAYAFASGFTIEFVAVFWVNFTTRGRKWKAGAMSALQALALVYGVTLSGQSRAVCAAFVVGYALGSVVAVSLKGRHANRPGQP